MRTCAFSVGIMLLALALGRPAGGADVENPALLGVERFRDIPPYTPTNAAVTLLLSKSRYPAEDQHLDAVVWLGGASSDGIASGALDLTLHDKGGRALASSRIEPIPGPGVFFSHKLPAVLAGSEGTLRVSWRRAGVLAGQAEGTFAVQSPARVATRGRVPLRVPNAPGATLKGAPMTVGVPFPRGALDDEHAVRLMNETGVEIPMQTKVTSRWSRFGSIRWLLCDFTVDLDGQARELHLEYGPEIARREGRRDWVRADAGANFPSIEAGPLRLNASGVSFDADGQGSFESALAGEALRGAFVQHATGTVYSVAAGSGYRLDEIGAEKVVVAREGWYQDPSGGRFCKYVTRFVVHRRSSLVRIFHTWIFTGDAYADRIANMGWRFPLASQLAPDGFLDTFGKDGKWLPGQYLVQRDFEEYDLGGPKGVQSLHGRPTGVLAASGKGLRLSIGNRDFHQNYPREIEFADDAMVYYEWPRHGRPARHTVHHESPYRLWFAHEGEALNLALPEAYTEVPIINEISSSRRGSREYTYAGVRQHMANAQGIAKTVELWLLFTDAGKPATGEARVLEGVSEETLRAVVAPEWMAASGAFHEIHPRDTARFPDYERAYELQALAPMLWADRVRIHGKWLWGVAPHSPRLHERYQPQHRAFRKSHHGWPYSLIPYIRSGDPRFLRYADAATRFQTDIAFCHYSDTRVSELGGERARSRGWYTRDRIPWAHNRRMPTSRAREDKVDYLWNSYYLTGYARARDVALDYGGLTKNEGVGETGNWNCRMALDYAGKGDNRVVSTLLRTYIEMYEATFDPWFLMAAHRIADRLYGVFDLVQHPNGLAYNTGLVDFHRFTGDPAMEDLLLRIARARYGQREDGVAGGWETVNATMIGSLAYVWRMTGEPFYAQRLAGWLDRARAATYDGFPDYYRGVLVSAKPQAPELFPSFTGSFLQQFPLALGVLADAGEPVSPLPAAFYQSFPKPDQPAAGEPFIHRSQIIAFRKSRRQAIPLALRVRLPYGAGEVKDRYRYVVEPPAGDPIRGEWNGREDATVELPAGAPDGVYRLRVEGASASPASPRLYIPVTPPGVPEIIVLGAAESMRPASAYANYWFRMHETAETFRVAFNVPVFAPTKNDCPLVRFTIWDGDGKQAWLRQLSRQDEPEIRVVQADVRIPKEQRGRLWHIVLPHERAPADGGDAFTWDARIPPIFATSPERWFDPRPSPAASVPGVIGP